MAAAPPRDDAELGQLALDDATQQEGLEGEKAGRESAIFR